MEQVGSDGNEAENFRCEPRDSNLFEFCSILCYRIVNTLESIIRQIYLLMNV